MYFVRPTIYEGENEFKEKVKPMAENGLELDTNDDNPYRREKKNDLDKGQNEGDLLHNNLLL